MFNEDFPVYLFTGFLESGKTKFIQETLEDKRFNNGEKTLLVVCEEGMEEYEPDQFYGKNVYIKYIESEDELSEETFKSFAAQTHAERCVIEYNGMWMLDNLYTALPEEWIVYQEFMFADASTFLSYNANMRQLTYDKLKSCELVIFNRFKKEYDKMEYHKIVRAASRRADICYENEKGDVEYDDIVDPLPFDVDAPVIEIADEDYAVWYRDLSEEAKKYDGKTVKFKAKALFRDKLPKGTFVAGRHVMTCCEADIQFAGLVFEYSGDLDFTDNQWITVTAKIEIKFHRAYGKRGPVLTYIESFNCNPPEQEVATFY